MDALEMPESPASGMLPVGRFETLGEAREYALVVLAMGLDCLITVEEDGYVIHGEEAFVTAIEEEFRLYAEEQELPAAPETVPVFGSGVNLALIWISVLLFCFALQLQHTAGVDRYLGSSLGVWEQGEWYRAFSSLFLHADLEHLMGNAVFGTVFGIFVANSFGPLRGWGLILLSGFLGNLASTGLHYPDERYSLGASTAVFGALGLLVGSGLNLAWRERSFRKGLRAFTPLLAGLTIFGMSGIGGVGTDNLAHVTGMVSGILLGLPVAHLLVRTTG